MSRAAAIILYSLEFCKKVVGNAVQQAVSVVKAKRNVSMNHDFCCFPIEKVSDFSNTMDIEIRYTANVLHLVVHA